MEFKESQRLYIQQRLIIMAGCFSAISRSEVSRSLAYRPEFNELTLLLCCQMVQVAGQPGSTCGLAGCGSRITLGSRAFKVGWVLLTGIFTLTWSLTLMGSSRSSPPKTHHTEVNLYHPFSLFTVWFSGFWYLKPSQSGIEKQTQRLSIHRPRWLYS
jgi:hypothetical protein